jgi:hypothetical protein
MRKMIIWAALATIAAIPTSASAQRHGGGYNREVRQEVRECRRELRGADNRREYRREQRECRREISQARRETRRDWRDDRRGYGGRDRYDRRR